MSDSAVLSAVSASCTSTRCSASLRSCSMPWRWANGGGGGVRRGGHTPRAAGAHLAGQLHTPCGSCTPRAAVTQLVGQLHTSRDSYTTLAAVAHFARQPRISSDSYTSRGVGTRLARQLHILSGRYGYQPMDIDKKE